MAIPYYRWFPGDYSRDTRHLSLMQHGVYRLLIDLYMDHGGPLRNDLAYLYRWLHAESVEEKNAVEFVLTEFFVLEDTIWRHKRCDSEIVWRDKRGIKARESAEMRWKSTKTPDNANAMRTHSERNANQNQNQNHISPSRKQAFPDEFRVSESMSQWAQSEGLPPHRIGPETEQFMDFHVSHGNRRLDWKASWRTWIRNAVKYAKA